MTSDVANDRGRNNEMLTWSVHSGRMMSEIVVFGQVSNVNDSDRWMEGLIDGRKMEEETRGEMDGWVGGGGDDDDGSRCQLVYDRGAGESFNGS